LTPLTEEVDVEVIIIAVGSMAVAKLEAQPAAAVFDGMHQMLLAEEAKGSEDATLVNALYALFQLGQRQRSIRSGQGTHHYNAVRRWFYTMLCQ
jgi:hypothetical protein